MSDFVIQLGHGVDVETITSMLRDRSGMAQRDVQSHTFPWGNVVLQVSANKGCAPLLTNGELWCCAGRPYFLGWSPNLDDPMAMMRSVRERWRHGDMVALGGSLSGMYVIARCTSDRVEVLTDQMGFRPCYTADNSDGECCGVATLVDAAARLSDRPTCYDMVSLAELLCYLQISFPHTSRVGVTELEPASHIIFDPGQRSLAPTIRELWRPLESASRVSENELVETLLEVMHEAGRDVTRGLTKVACTLSGGWDSRAVLSVMPKDISVDALTYRTVENRETRSARRAAKAARVRYRSVDRDETFFEHTFLRGLQLTGIELRPNSFGYGLVDAGLVGDYEVVIGGQLCDAFLKDSFVSAARLEESKDLTAAERTSIVDKTGHAQYRTAIENCLRPALVVAARQRRAFRREQLRAWRPKTAAIWQWFYPVSRQDDAGHNLGNSRLYPSDSLYMHRGIVSYAAAYPIGGPDRTRVTRETFLRLYGAMAKVPLAETGQPPAVVAAPIRHEHGMVDRMGKVFTRMRDRVFPREDWWRIVQTSWVNWKRLQQHSPRWAQIREESLDEKILTQLVPLYENDPKTLLGQYQAEFGPTANLIMMQIAEYIRLSSDVRTADVS